MPQTTTSTDDDDDDDGRRTLGNDGDDCADPTTTHKVHPSVPCVLLTPICPHSLSCRPMVLPDSAELVCRNSHDARADAWVSFDGKHRKRLRKGQALRITMSTYPLPTVNKVDDTVDWFHGIASAFHFNERPLQRPLSPKNAPP